MKNYEAVFSGTGVHSYSTCAWRGRSSKKRTGSYWGNWGGSTVSVCTPKIFFAGLLQNKNEVKCAIQIAKIIHSYLHRRVKKGKLDPRALLGILI